ncbi:Nucleoside diphosphate-linked moiety X motif 19, mitochondrial, variant 2 [Stylosanthes scabra]|uniref:Nucleoside diphosphate-linked moiety X motif 19, mitochondrial, variant 2 n=1 Tax=Stylosanthes scabra TaxID=79078 RepID=A0ABU6QKS5_9FABA|nr:Nucleoside diphosphate-linked moiety X motif 19, mitochondrial, variant 2 [Stylosanthes scabra]
MLNFLHLLVSSSSPSQPFSILKLHDKLSPQSPSHQSLTISFSQYKPPFPTVTATSTMSVHAFAGNPLRSNSADACSPASALETLEARLQERTATNHHRHLKVLPFKNGKPLASSAAASGDDSRQLWKLGWLDLDDLRVVLGNGGCGELSGGSFVYLGSSTEDDAVYWAIEVSSESGLIGELEKRNLCFVELRTLMVATDCVELRAMGNLAIAGHARALLEWHRTSRFCGHCGEKTVPMEAGRRKQCSNESCKKTIYPRIDPVVIMLVIDQENDRALLCKQSRFVPRMWSCLAGFIEMSIYISRF